MSASVQFTIGAETVNTTAGTAASFSIPVTETGTPTAQSVSTFAAGNGLNADVQLARGPDGYVYTNNFGGTTISRISPAGVVSQFTDLGTGNQPRGLAFDSAGNLYVGVGSSGAANGDVLDRITPAGAVTQVATGFTQPDGLAIDSSGNIYVANLGTGTARDGTTVDKVTPGGAVSTFVGGFTNPVGVAFDAAGNLYVSDQNLGTISKVTSAGVVSTFASGFADPEQLAFDAAGNLYVANANANDVAKVTPAGVVSTFAGAIGSPLGLAFVKGDLFVTNGANNAVDRISTAVTVPFTVGGTAVAGTDFTVTTASPLTFAGGTTTATITGTLTPAAAGTANKTVTFTLGTPTAGAVDGTPATNTLTIAEPAAAAPTLTGISPNSVAAGSGDTTITLTGTNFTPASVAQDNGTSLSTTYLSPTQLTAVVPAADLTTAGAESIAVATPNEPTTSAVPLAVTQPQDTLTSISPGSTFARVATTVTLTGANFTSGSVVGLVNDGTLPTTFVSPTQLMVTFPAGFSAGSYQVFVSTPNEAATATQPFTILPDPMLTAVSPNAVTAGAPATTITLTGTGFTANTVAAFNGTPLATTYVSPTQLTAVVPTADLTTAAVDAITVVLPNVPTTGSAQFTVNPAGVGSVQFATGSESTAGTATTFSVQVTESGTPTPVVTAVASGFTAPYGTAEDAAGNVYVTDQRNGTLTKVAPDGTKTVLTSALTSAYGVVVDGSGNAYVGTGTAISKVAPDGTVSTLASGLTGAHFLAFDRSGNLYTTGSSGTINKVSTTGAVTAYATGLGSVSQFAFDPSGNLFAVNSAGGEVLKVAPGGGAASNYLAGPASNYGLAIDAAGDLFLGNDTAEAIDVVPAGTTTVAPYATGVATRHTILLLSESPAGDLYVSQPLGTTTTPVEKVSTTFTVPFTTGGTALAGTDYTVTSTSPLAFATGQTTQTITGTLNPATDAGKTITFTLGPPSASAVVTGSPSTNTLTVTAMAPTLTSASPSTIQAGDPSTTVTLTGTNFTPTGTTANFNGTPIATTYVSSTQVTAVIPTADLTNPGTDAITVTTPGGTTSSVPFTVTDPNAGVNVAFTAGSETVAASAGTFSIPVTLTQEAFTSTT